MPIIKNSSNIIFANELMTTAIRCLQLIGIAIRPLLKSRKPAPMVKSYLVACQGDRPGIELIPMLGFSRGEVALTTKELWPHLAVLNVTENPDWHD